LEEDLDLRFLYLKDDGQNPTASLKDRASSIGVVKAMEKGAKVITCASTGNAASSLAGYAAAAGLESYIFVPERAPQAKIAQLLIFGAHVLLVKGSYDQAHDLCEMAVKKWGWYNRNCAVNPYLVEGKKTAGLEICEQMDWVSPDKVFVSVGDGCTISGIWKGFKEFHHLGLIKNLPQMIGIQAEGCQPIKKAFETFSPVEPVTPNTIADSIAVGTPRNWIKALKSVRESGGFFVGVTDEEILEAMKKLARSSGIFGEPAGVAGFAGLLKLLKEGRVDKEERLLVMITGSGLKDVESAFKAGGSCFYVEPSLEDLEKTLEEKKNGN